MIAWYKGSFVGKLPILGQIIFWAGVAFAIYKIYMWIKRKIESGNYNAAVSQSQTALNQLAQQGVRPSYGQAQYTTYANGLQGAFQGCSGSLNASNFWSTVEPVFQAMKNDADIYALIKAYGVRKIDACGWLTGDFEGDLAGTLSEKFSGVEGTLIGGPSGKGISTINAALKSNGLVFTF